MVWGRKRLANALHQNRGGASLICSKANTTRPARPQRPARACLSVCAACAEIPCKARANSLKRAGRELRYLMFNIKILNDVYGPKDLTFTQIPC